jgi:tetratricopeptide (TPR) repeat protein
MDKTKMKCVVCASARGKRICRIREQSSVCPGCCAEIRNPECGGCSYYADAAKYGVDKMKNSNFRDFTEQIAPEVDKAVDDALKIAERGNIPKAEALLTGLREKHPDVFKVQYGMGTLHAMKGNFRESVFLLGKCLETFPYFIEAWFNKAVAYKNLGDLGNTVRSFRKVVEVGDRDHHLAIKARKLLRDMETSIGRNYGLPIDRYLESMDEFERASALMREKEYEKAITGFNDVLAVIKYHPQSYGNLGLCHAFLGNKEEALSAFNRALAIDPMYKPAFTNRAILLNLPEGEKMSDDYVKKVDFYRDPGEGD